MRCDGSCRAADQSSGLRDAVAVDACAFADPAEDFVQGIVGEGYTRMLRGESNILPDDGTFYGNPDDYLLPHYFPADVPASHLLLLPASAAHRKLLKIPRAPASDLAAAAARLNFAALPEAGAGGFSGHV